MQHFRLRDKDNLFQVDVRLWLPFEMVTDERAESLLQSTLLMAMAVLLEGGEWPNHALYTIRDFMLRMQRELEAEQESEE